MPATPASLMRAATAILDTVESFIDTCPDLEGVDDVRCINRTPITLTVVIDGCAYKVLVTSDT